MDHKDLIIIALIVATIYLYYQNRKQKSLFYSATDPNQAQEISETIANLREENENLVSDKDSAIRSKNEAEAEALSLGNKLKNKQQEVGKKDAEITKLKKEKSASEIALNKKLKELKEKYSKQGQLLDEEQLENNKLTEKIESLETKITELKKPIPGSWEANRLTELEETVRKKEKKIQELEKEVCKSAKK